MSITHDDGSTHSASVNSQLSTLYNWIVHNKTFRSATNVLRGLAAFSVLLWHYQHFFFKDRSNFDANNQPLFRLFGIFYESGYLAVQLFWSISGLVLCHAYMNRLTPNWSSFFWARFSRLYPLHLITLIVVAILQLANLHVLHAFRIYQVNDVRHFILNIFFIQSWGLENGYSFNAPTWSVSVEIAVYLLYFFSIPLLKRTRLFGSLALLGMWSITSKMIGGVFFYECLGYFLAGVALWFAVSNKSPLKSISSGFFVTAFSIIILSGNSFSFKTTVLMTSLFIATLLDQSKLPIHGKSLRRFGELTYSVFLWHVPIQLFIILSFERASISISIFETAPFFFIYLALVYGIANFSFIYLENPLKRLILNRSLSPKEWLENWWLAPLFDGAILQAPAQVAQG